MPFRLKKYSIFDTTHEYFDEPVNEAMCRKHAKQCILPVNKLLHGLISQYEGRFRVALSISGSALEMMESHSPEALEGLQQLADTGYVEFIGSPYYHSLSSLYSDEEFADEVSDHGNLVSKLFGDNRRPVVFMNTAMIFNNRIADMLGRVGGFRAVFVDDSMNFPYWYSPSRICNTKTDGLRALVMSNILGEEIRWLLMTGVSKEKETAAESFSRRLLDFGCRGDCNVMLGMNYRLLWESDPESDIKYSFMHSFLSRILEDGSGCFALPGEMIDRHEGGGNQPERVADVPHPVYCPQSGFVFFL